MKDYKKIPFNRIKDIKAYLNRKLRAGYMIIAAVVDEEEEEISALYSYVNDKNNKSYFKTFIPSDDIVKLFGLEDMVPTKEDLKKQVLEYYMEPYYAYKDKNKKTNVHFADVDIDMECPGSSSFDEFNKKIEKGMEHYNGEHYLLNESNDRLYYEYYISKDVVSMGGFGGDLETYFVMDWMEEKGYYTHSEV